VRGFRILTITAFFSSIIVSAEHVPASLLGRGGVHTTDPIRGYYSTLVSQSGLFEKIEYRGDFICAVDGAVSVATITLWDGDNKIMTYTYEVNKGSKIDFGQTAKGSLGLSLDNKGLIKEVYLVVLTGELRQVTPILRMEGSFLVPMGPNK
jgi:hypothetical protein